MIEMIDTTTGSRQQLISNSEFEGELDFFLPIAFAKYLQNRYYITEADLEELIKEKYPEKFL